jgi:hypothetical protein
MRRIEPAPAPAPQLARRRRPTRWLVHGSLLVAAFAVGAVALVWPQWLAVDGARAALTMQLEREEEFEDRLDSLRVLNERLRDWQHDARRVFLKEELASYGRQVQLVAKREGTMVNAVQVRAQSTGRWRSVSLRQFVAEGQPEGAGEIQPRTVRVVLTGSFDGIYRTVAALSRQQQLFLPEKWDIAPSSPGDSAMLRADVLATVFAVQEPEEKPVAPVNSGPVAANVLMEELQ